MCSSMVDIQSPTAEIRRGKKKEERRQKLEMWANAQRDGRPAEYRWSPLFNATVWLTPTILECREVTLSGHIGAQQVFSDCRYVP